MIKTITIDIINDKAMKLLKDLEFLELIRVHEGEVPPAGHSLKDRYKGAMSKQSISDIDRQLEELRSEWG